MVSFSCEECADVISKKGLDKHRNQCRRATFSCLDCNTHFQSFDKAKAHTSCITEAEKYEGPMYKEKEKKSKADKRKSVNWDPESQVMQPKRAYVEDVPEGDDSQAVAVIDVPPKAPSPPPANAGAVEMSDNVNVFDYLIPDDATNGNKSAHDTPDEQRMVEHPVYYSNGEYPHHHPYTNGHLGFTQYGFAYGNSPVPLSYSRYDSWQDLADSQHSHNMQGPPYFTPAPKELRKDHEKKDNDKRVSIAENSEKKRKRHQVEELDLSSAKRPSSRDATMTDAPRDERVLHSGLTGGLSKLVTDPEFYEDRIDSGPTPVLSPIKRSRRDEDLKKANRRKSSYAAYDLATTKPSSTSRPSDDIDKRERKKYHDDTHRRREGRYYDDKHHRSRSAERTYHGDRYRERYTNGNAKHRASISSSEERYARKPMRVIEYPVERKDKSERPGSLQPHSSNQIISYRSRADLFMSFISKGPDSERGCSINKVLKRYHRERDIRGEGGKEEESKELWKLLRLRRNDRGEIVLFV